jgi:murein DD-endopeptidase MepM/ murein hydrolase activator NlpD
MSVMRNIRFLVIAACLSACALKPPPDMPAREGIVPGETITIEGNPNVYAVARAHNVSMREIIVINNLQPPYQLSPGQRIILPMVHGASASGASASGTSAPGAGSWGAPAAAPSGVISHAPLSPVQSSGSGVMPAPVTSEPVEELNKPTPPSQPVLTTVKTSAPQQRNTQQMAALPPPVPAPANKPAPSEEDLSNAPDFVWPVQGPVVSSFGPKGQGLSNDGVNIAAPKGAPVVAAAGGIVVYAGNEMKGFGNLVLIRHEQGWVTAYAHLDRIVVAKDGVVAKGDMIGTVGKTGNVPSPQLHFEVRHESKPLDPASVVKTD